MEIPDKVGAHFNELVIVLLGGNGIIVDAGIAGGNSIGEFMRVQDFHSLDNFLIDALPAAAVGCFFKALQRDCGNEVAHPAHLLCKGIINQCAVGKAQKNTVVVLFTQADQVVFADHGLPSGVDIHIDAQLLALSNDTVNLIQAEVEPVAIRCRPAPGTVQVTGTGGIQKNCPGNIAVIFLPEFFLIIVGGKVGIDEEIRDYLFENIRINITEHVQNKVVIRVIRIFDNIPDYFSLRLQSAFRKIVCPVHQLFQIGFRIFVNIVKGLFDTEFF